MEQMREHQVHLVNGEIVTVRGAVVVKDETAQYLVFETQNCLYRFWWPNILYYVSRYRGGLWQAGATPLKDTAGNPVNETTNDT